MAIKKNNTDSQINFKKNKSLLESAKDEKKVGRKTINEKGLKANQRNAFLLNEEQQLKMEKRMEELGIRNKTDYIFRLLKQDIPEL